MTTITIKNGKKLKKTNFLNVGELIDYLLENDGYGRPLNVRSNSTKH